ncbi:unnamed protein product [Tetraodon nigroviridis]|uniref:(spotted green pufferfish) hypothetical protein n=1 Tax=Tetraodon nigroviridis TaxID=99883 RepID=Q4RY28_TETNG|nr:unnamed protein product [Tetraodon nigroviridis]
MATETACQGKSNPVPPEPSTPRWVEISCRLMQEDKGARRELGADVNICTYFIDLRLDMFRNAKCKSGVSAPICRAITFSGLCSQRLRCGSVGQSSMCVFVWFSDLFSSLGSFSSRILEQMVER